MKTLLVTGTDTNVGKTWVTSLLVREFRRSGISTGAYKPVCSGAEKNSQGDLVWADIEALRAACGTEPEIDLVCPQRFYAAVAPNIAARMENRGVDNQRLVDGVARWSSYVDRLVIEGAGGIFCPLSDQLTVMDIAVELRIPTIVVAANRLGVINHTRLTVEALQVHGVEVVAVVLNEIGPPAQEKSDPSIPSNAAQIRRWLPEIPLYHCDWQGTKFNGLSAAVSLIELLQ
ncbi:MAG: dethiobiotin synthase [Planctomycetaceae bacterium]